MNSTEKQRLLLSYLLSEPSAFSMCRSIMDASHFDKELQAGVRFMLEHADKYKSVPNAAMIAAETGLSLQSIGQDEGQVEHANRIKWVCDEIELHCRTMATVNAVYAASESIARGDLDSIVDPIKKAVMTSLQRDLGIDYFKDPSGRLRRMFDTEKPVPTGFKHVDQILDGGVMRGGINIFVAESGGGKSMMLANMAVNFCQRGEDVLYITLELPESWVAKRVDSMMTGIPSRQINGRIDEVHGILLKRRSGCGQFRIKYLPANSTTNQIAAYLKTLEIELGFVPAMIVIDYLDLVSPTAKIDINNISLKDKYTTEELRNICMELAACGFTASQTTKGSDGSEGFKQGDVAGGKTKVNTADNVVSMYQSLEMKEDGYLELFFTKTRTSGGQNRKVRLGMDVETLRYRDMDDERAFPSRKKVVPRSVTGQSTVAEVGQETGTTNFERLAALKAKLGRGA